MVVIQLPTAATSFYTVQKRGKGWAVLLVTPCGSKPIRTALRFWADRESAIADGKDAAELTQRPFKEPKRGEV